MAVMKDRAARSDLYAWLPALIVILTIVAVAVAALALHNLETELVAFAGESLGLAATDIADKLDLLLFENYSDIQVLAGALDSHMHDTKEVAKHLLSWQLVHPSYLWMGVTDASGQLIAATDEKGLGQSRHMARWFQAVKEREDVFVENAAPSAELGGALAVSFSSAIKGTEGQFIGAVTTRVGLPALETVFARTIRLFQLERGIRGQVRWVLMGDKGDILFDSETGKPGRENLVQSAQSSALLLTSSLLPGYVEEQLPLRHTKVLTGYARTEGYGRFPGLQWGVMVHIHRREVLVPIFSLLGVLGTVGAAAVAPLLILLFWTSLRLQKEWKNLQDREAKLAMTLASTTDAMIVAGTDGLVTSMNKAAEALMGWDQEVAVGKTLDHLVSFKQARSDQHAEHPIEAVLASGTPIGIPPVTLVANNGRELIVEGSAAPLKDESGAVAGVMVVLRDITERMRAERRRDAQYAVTRVLAEAVTLDDAAPRLLETICKSLGWSVGLMFTVDEKTNQLELVEFWHTEADTVPTLAAGGQGSGAAPGLGLPGKVLAEKKPVWVSDLARDHNLPGAPLAEKARLHGAFAFPVVSGEKVLGVLEFFSHEVRQPDHDLLQMLGAIGIQIGNFMERRQLEREVRQGRKEP